MRKYQHSPQSNPQNAFRQTTLYAIHPHQTHSRPCLTPILLPDAADAESALKPAELAVLNRLWPLVDDRLNYFTPTKKPLGWGADKHGRRKRLYDRPRTPLNRLLAAGVLSPGQHDELITYRDRLNPAEMARDIHRYQAQLIGLAKDKTDHLRVRMATTPPASKGIRTG